MPAFLEVDLEKVPQIEEGRAGVAEPALLLDRGRLGVPLRDDQAPELRAEFPRHLLPHGLAEGIAEANRSIGDGVGEKDSPAVIGHLHRAVVRPSFGVDADRRAQIHVGAGEVARPHLAPPIPESRLPVLERALQRAVVGEVDVVGDFFGVIDRHGQTLSRSNFAFAPVPYTFSAPCSPTAFGRLKIQFCQALSLPKIRVSMLSLPGKRRFASRPVSASGERLARSSSAMRASFSPSPSSGANVTPPSSAASCEFNLSPTRRRALSACFCSPQKRADSRVSSLTMG